LKNFEHARALLLRLEHESAGIKVASRKQTVQTDLQAKREVIKKLQMRIQELDSLAYKQGDGDEDDEDDEEEEGSDADQGYTYAPPIKASDSLDFEPSAAQDSTPEPHNTLRARTRSRPTDSAASQSQSVRATGTSHLPAPTATASARIPSPDREKMLDLDRRQKDQITDAIYDLARELKTSAQSLDRSIEDENRTSLKRAMEGLDKGAEGMEAAGQRMGALRRMTEGKGWWGRMMLYAWIAGLWLLLFLMMTLLPKLRF
jgi:hypothetical protein